MGASPRVVLLTGDARRHRYAAVELARQLHLVGMVVEAKVSPLAAAGPVDPPDEAVIRQHLDERDRVEADLLGRVDGAALDAPVLYLRAGGLRAPAALDWIAARQPDALVLFGSSIVPAPILERFEHRVVNLHLGLSPYYRGSATNFWALVHGEPECVGATIHLATAAVDGGPILAQCRPEPVASDGVHELGTRALVAALPILVQALRRHLGGALVPQPQTRGTGRLYRRADLTADAIRRVRANLADGMMAAYIGDAVRRRAAYPIVELGSGCESSV